MMAMSPTFYEFFAGAGMARAGLGAKWRCVFANEFDLKKSVTYRKNWKTPDVLKVADVGTLTTADLPGAADFAWARPFGDVLAVLAPHGMFGG